MKTQLTLRRLPPSGAMLINIICYAYILLFLYAAFYKLFDYDYFIRQLGHSPILKNYRLYVACIVPTSEIITSILLLIPRTKLIGLVLAITIMSCFIAYIVYILNFSPHIPCSCGGILATMNWQEHLVFNTVFIVLGIIALVLQVKIKPI